MGIASEIIARGKRDHYDRLADNRALLDDVKRALSDATLALDVFGLASAEYREAAARLYACQIAWVDDAAAMGRELGQPEDPRFEALRTLALRNAEKLS